MMTLNSDYLLNTDARNGIFYRGHGPAPYGKCPTTATAYHVTNFYGDVVSSGSLNNQFIVTLLPPEGGWRCGWYVFVATGPDLGPPDYTTYAAGIFAVVPYDTRFLPTPSGNTVMTGGNGESPDVIAKGVLGVGTSRIIVGITDQPWLDRSGDLNAQINMAQDEKTWWTNPASQYLDPVRPRAQWCIFTNGTVDSAIVWGSDNAYGYVYVKDISLNPERIYVSVGPGTSSGAKIRVYTPNASTVVETYDNLSSPAAAVTAINGISNYIMFYAGSASASAVVDPMAIGRLRLPAGANNNWYGDVFCLDGTQAANTYVKIGPGSASGAKITVYVGGTAVGNIVETYDNISDNHAAQTIINAASPRIQFLSYVYGTRSDPGTTNPTALNTTMIRGTKNCVTQLLAAGCDHFEGPYNEPNISNPAIVQEFKLFIDTVRTVPGAKAIGPSSVSLQPLPMSIFINICNSRGIKPDALSLHAYDLSQRLPQDRDLFAQFIQVIESGGWGDLDRWETELNPSGASLWGIWAPWFALQLVYLRLLIEEFGFVRERATPWYDADHGFTSIPSFWEESNGLLHPGPYMLRTITAETWNSLYDSRFVFPGIWDNLVCGWRYNNQMGNDDCLIFFSQNLSSFVVTLHTDTSIVINLVDPWGNRSSVTPDPLTGKFDITVKTLLFLKVPHGATFSVITVNGWSKNELANGDAAAYQPASVDGVSTGLITSPPMATFYTSPTEFPSTIIIPLGTHRNLYRLIIVGSGSSLINFSIDTSSDGGVTWTSRRTINTSAKANMLKMGDTRYHLFWKREGAFDVALPAPLQGTTHIRINATRISYGDWPDSVIYDNYHWDKNDFASFRRIMAVADGVYPHTYIEQVIQDGALALWPLNETPSSTLATEMRGLLSNGTYLNLSATTFGIAAPSGMRDFTAVRFSKVGGVTGNITNVWPFPVYLKATFDDFFTVEGWVNMSTLDTGPTTLFGSGSRFIAVEPNGNIHTSGLNGPYDAPLAAANKNLPIDGKWHHVVWVKNGAVNKIYLDSVDITGSSDTRLYGAGTDNTGFSVNGDASTSNAGFHAQGSFCMVAMYNVSLTAVQIANHYSLGMKSRGQLNTRILERR